MDESNEDDLPIIVAPIHFEEALVPAHLLQGMGPLGITPEEQCLILQYVACLQSGPKTGWRTASSLAQRMGITSVRVQQLIAGLKKRGFWNGAEGLEALRPLDEQIFDKFGANEEGDEEGDDDEK